MIPLVIDITPLAINRTAMYFIVRDTVRYLIDSGLPVRLHVMGEPVDLAEFIANDFLLHAGIEARVGQIFGEILGNPESVKTKKKHDLSVWGGPCINMVFDPLYLLFVGPAVRTIAYVLDLTPITRPNWHNERVSQLYAAAFEKLYDSQVDILSISESTARDLWANLGIPRERGRVIPLYDRFADTRATIERKPKKQILFVGSLESRKNITGLIRGFSLSGLAQDGYSLHIVGGDGHGSDLIKAMAQSTPGVVLCGRLSDEQLVLEYEHCTCLAYPSYWEGFGLPALEALGRGIPLLVADTGALPEVCGEFATYVDPCNPHAIAAGLAKVCKRAGVVVSGEEVRAFEARRAWLSKYSYDAYLAAVDAAITATYAEASLSFDVKGQVSKEAVQPLPEPSQRRLSWRMRLMGSIIRRSRIVPAVLREVPGNSFSLDYLYCLQQERRLRLSRTMARFMSGRIWMYPWYAVRTIMEVISLQCTNSFVRASINEIVIQKLATRLERPE